LNWTTGIEGRIAASAVQIGEQLRSISGKQEYRTIEQTEFIRPNAILASLLQPLYPNSGYVVVVHARAGNFTPVKIAWGGHTLGWGLYYGPVELFPEESRVISTNLVAFVDK
jgi:hypothetical protein